MSDTITTTTEQSWFSRIGDAIKGVVFGLILAALAFVLLFWNEGRAVKTARSLDEGGGAVVSIEAATVSPATEGKLVHLTGTAKAEGQAPSDPFGVSAPGALYLVRKVEMYQWKEKTDSKTEKKLGGGTTTTKTTTYEKVWSENNIDSSRFASPADHTNPNNTFTTMIVPAQKVTVGAHTLNSAQIRAIPATTPVPLKEGTPFAVKSKVSVADGYAYLGETPATPTVGDKRVSFTCAAATEVSLLAKQQGDTFAPYTTSNGRTIDMLKPGKFTAAAMFTQAEAANAKMTWGLRGLGFILMGLGFMLVLRPLSVLADVVPFIGDLIEAGAAIIAFTAAAALSLVTIAVAWIAYRPLVGISLLLVAGGVAYAIHRRRNAKKAATPVVAEPAQA